LPNHVGFGTQARRFPGQPLSLLAELRYECGRLAGFSARLIRFRVAGRDLFVGGRHLRAGIGRRGCGSGLRCPAFAAGGRSGEVSP
jgi:hypothetical protein